MLPSNNKIALVDNMNNNFFAFARYLRDEGVNAHLYKVSNRKIPHFEPEADTFVDISNEKWIHNFPLEVNNKGWLFFSKRKVYNEFKNYKIIISCGLCNAFLLRGGVKVDIIMPYGSDLYDLPFRNVKLSFSLDFIRSFLWYHQGKYQRESFLKASLVIANPNYNLYREPLNKLELQICNFGIPMVYNKENLENDKNMKLWGFIKNHDFIVFNHSRQYWRSNIKEDNISEFDKYGGLKRNDKLIKAFARFIKVTRLKSPILVLFEYGIDVESSKQLITELGINKYVKWMPTLPRKYILYGLSKATFSANAFRENIVDIGGVCYESMAVGTTLINNCIEVIKDKKYKFYNAPIVHALSEDDILNIFIDYEKNPKKYKEIGKKSKEWFDKHLGIGLAKKYVKLIELLTKDKTLTCKDERVKKIFKNNEQQKEE